jgi:hypothetical protein
MAKLKTETLIIAFYVLYFSWLFTVAFLTREAQTLNIFTGIVVLFYFIFLKEDGDFRCFASGFILALILGMVSFSGWMPRINFEAFRLTPPWLPVAWGTTFVALRKFYLTLSR